MKSHHHPSETRITAGGLSLGLGYLGQQWHHIHIEAGVFMHGHVSKTDHSLHAVGKISRKNSRSL